VVSWVETDNGQPCHLCPICFEPLANQQRKLCYKHEKEYGTDTTKWPAWLTALRKLTVRWERRPGGVTFRDSEEIVLAEYYDDPLDSIVE